jgi:predicted dehydrogenase
MNQTNQKPANSQSRRKFLKSGGALAAGSVLAGIDVPKVHAAGDNTIRLALIGCGGRGSGAVGNALGTSGGSVQLYAMADLYESRLNHSCKALKDRYEDQIDVLPERKFVGFDAYRHAIDNLRPDSGDVALLTAYSYIRPTHLEYAVERGVNVFMEKPFAPDPGGLQRMLRAGKEADKKNLKIAAGLMCRHSVARQTLIQKIRDGQLGDIQLIRAYRMGRGSNLGVRKSDQKELKWQIKNRVHFHWGGSGWLIEMMIHQIDECCWIKDSWPVAAQGLGGRSPNNTSCGQNLDTYSIEYTFADGATALVQSRAAPRCYNDFSTYVHGSKNAAQFSGNIHAATVHTYRDQRIDSDHIDWKADKEPCTPWQAEWNVLLEKIRRNEPHNETSRAVNADFASIMGRAAVHMGKIVTWDEVMASNFQFCPNVDDLNFESSAPVSADAQGRYPVPIPGQWSEV